MKLANKILYFFCATCRPNQSPTVRYAFPLIFAVAAFLGAAAVVSDNKSYIHLESSTGAVKAGEAFHIDVYVNAVVPVNAVDISLEFPKNQIEIAGIDTGESVITLWAKDPYVEGNKVIMQGGTFRKGFKGDHLIATINAKATETGLAQFKTSDVVLLAGDGTGSKVAISKSDKESTSLYISKEDGTFTKPSEAVGIKANASVVIVTDIDGDGQVTLSDISSFMAAWSTKSALYDFNNDGAMTFRDFGIILADSFLR
jgi:hypothetical protein